VGEGEDYTVDLGAQIEEEIEARLSALEEKLSEQLSGLDERILEHAQQWGSHAERLAEQAQSQAMRAVERARRSLARQSKRKRGSRPRRGAWGAPPAASTGKPPEPVTEQERLLILQMVQENKISIEEAEQLLSALES
jgi:hypothetical protein